MDHLKIGDKVSINFIEIDWYDLRKLVSIDYDFKPICELFSNESSKIFIGEVIEKIRITKEDGMEINLFGMEINSKKYIIPYDLVVVNII